MHLKTQVTGAILWQFLSAEESYSQIIICLKSWKDMRECFYKTTFISWALIRATESKKKKEKRKEQVVIVTMTDLGAQILVKCNAGLFVCQSVYLI